jgi:isoleucyl-tRNA synthetase
MGHLLNKVLKDIIVKYKGLAGFDAPYVPGWDCHGMPIEHRVVGDLGERAKTMSKVDIRSACREYALKFVDRQRGQFKRLGVTGDWGNPYLTMSPEYEAKIVEAFHIMLKQGHVTRGKRPILWCPACRTALAEAEVEYADHESTSVTVAFPVKTLPEGVLPRTPRERLSVLIWTTTPWTLPANLGISLHPDFLYVSVKVGDDHYLLAKDLLNSTATLCGWKDPQVVEEVAGRDLDRSVCRHAFLERDSLVMVGGHVTADAGTGCVHTAPGHGREDYEIGLKYGLEVYSPVDEAGRFDERVPEWEGMNVFDANAKVVERLRTVGRLLAVETLKHSYPHCWRSKNPVIFRATTQWFIDIDHQDLRRRTLEAIRDVKWIPAWGQERITNMVSGRADWCISRQRSWGVPIAAFTCKRCHAVLVDDAVNARIASLVRAEGIDGWFKKDVADIVPSGTRCRCGSDSFHKEEDIIDVWFESGVSHMAVLETRPDQRRPADLYLEGSDQHRGWFQSALWTSMAARGEAPYHQVLTHGFMLDAKGHAMHKSAGNVIDPLEMAGKWGADVLRLWVAAQDYKEDVRIGPEMVERMSEAYRRVRNTFRFLLGNLSDFDPAKDSVRDTDLLSLDRWALHETDAWRRAVTQAYDEYDFTRVFHATDAFCAVTLSARYFDILKDRLYTARAASRERRSAQTALSRILRDLAVGVAPILSFTAEEVWQSLPPSFRREPSVFLADWPQGTTEPSPEELRELDAWNRVFDVKEDVSKALEGLRRDKVIGSSLQAEVDLYVGSETLRMLLEECREDLPYLFLVSKVTLKDGPQPAEAFVGEKVKGLFVAARKTEGLKCARCWNHYPALGSVPEYPDLCHRCGPIVRDLKGKGA